ncbi:ATP-binding protein [Ochrobactrum sp. BTU1]|uniref:ATP-binding protein n=1 Tax=Ochrobactrum sp. BTU1 TaxID=2840456 RepID=UPI00207B55E5
MLDKNSPADSQQEQKNHRSNVRKITIAIGLAWLLLIACVGYWAWQRIMAQELGRFGASADYEAQTTALVVDRLFLEMNSVANMVTGQNRVVELASRYRIDPPGFAELTREERAKILMKDPLVRGVGDFMTELSDDLLYARIYMNNLSHDTIATSQWSESFNILGQIYTGRRYLLDALRTGKGQLFGIARLNQMPSYFMTRRIDDANGQALGSVTVRFDAPIMAQYLTGRHIALIVNRQGRVTTASSQPFSLRNVAALMPQEVSLPSDSDEGPGEPMDIRPVDGAMQGDRWIIDGHQYLMRSKPLNDAEYQLVTLASLDHLGPLRQQHLMVASLVAGLGLLIILLTGHVVGQRVDRRLRAEQERVLAISQAAERDLTVKVHERTAELAESNRALEAEVERRRLLEDKLKQSLDSVNSALALQRNFVAVVSHEFRGPLAVIGVAADNLLVALADGSDHVKMRIAKISRTVKRMATLIENVLAGDRLDAGPSPASNLELLDLNEVLQTAMAGFDDDAANRIKVQRSDELVVKGDRILLEIAVHNLLQNALKYSSAPDPVHVHLSKLQGMALVNVSDSGNGVPDKDRDLIFMKYYRSKGQTASGSGLGLYIAREIARQNGGDLVLATSNTNGSTFSLSLPLETPEN